MRLEQVWSSSLVFGIVARYLQGSQKLAERLEQAMELASVPPKGCLVVEDLLDSEELKEWMKLEVDLSLQVTVQQRGVEQDLEMGYEVGEELPCVETDSLRVWR